MSAKGGEEAANIISKFMRVLCPSLESEISLDMLTVVFRANDGLYAMMSAKRGEEAAGEEAANIIIKFMRVLCPSLESEISLDMLTVVFRGGDSLYAIMSAKGGEEAANIVIKFMGAINPSRSFVLSLDLLTAVFRVKSSVYALIAVEGPERAADIVTSGADAKVVISQNFLKLITPKVPVVVSRRARTMSSEEIHQFQLKLDYLDDKFTGKICFLLFRKRSSKKIEVVEVVKLLQETRDYDLKKLRSAIESSKWLTSDLQVVAALFSLDEDKCDDRTELIHRIVSFFSSD